jgi:hypothetical protein
MERHALIIRSFAQAVISHTIAKTRACTARRQLVSKRYGFVFACQLSIMRKDTRPCIHGARKRHTRGCTRRSR